MASYCNSTDSMYGLPEEDAFNNDPVLQESLEYHEFNHASGKYMHDLEAGSSAGKSSSFHIQEGRPLYGAPDSKLCDCMILCFLDHSFLSYCPFPILNRILKMNAA